MPYSTAILTVVAGGFFLMGVAISAVTLNAVEAASTSTNYRLNIAKLAESRSVITGEETDIMVITPAGLTGSLSFQYPSTWDMTAAEELETWDYEFTTDERMLQIAILDSELTPLDSIKSILVFAEMEEEPDLTLLDSGETGTERLVYGQYSYSMDGEDYLISSVNIGADSEGNILRAVVQTGGGDISLMNQIVQSLNVSK